MQIKKKIFIKLNEDDVKLIIARHLKNEGYNVNARDVALNVETKCLGYGVTEYEVPYFKGAIVRCED
jgi:hypothetical protein